MFNLFVIYWLITGCSMPIIVIAWEWFIPLYYNILNWIGYCEGWVMLYDILNDAIDGFICNENVFRSDFSMERRYIVVHYNDWILFYEHRCWCMPIQYEYIKLYLSPGFFLKYWTKNKIAADVWDIKRNWLPINVQHYTIVSIAVWWFCIICRA